MFATILACLIVYIVAFIVSLMLMLVHEKDLTLSACYLNGLALRRRESAPQVRAS